MMVVMSLFVEDFHRFLLILFHRVIVRQVIETKVTGRFSVMVQALPCGTNTADACYGMIIAFVGMELGTFLHELIT